MTSRHTLSFARVVAVFRIAVFVAGPARCAIIHESATMGPINQYEGWGIHEYQFIGSRFYVAETMEVTHIGGHLASINDLLIFGAIVPLTGPTDLPNGSPFWSGEAVAVAQFRPPAWSLDVRVPLAVTLPPGWYGLVFGAGQFGTSWKAQASMPYVNQTLIPGSSFFLWNGYGWFHTNPSPPPRFVVEGQPPKPPVEIHGAKFDDTNGNGAWDNGEPGIAGWEFYLDIDGDGQFDTGEPNAIADPNGYYAFVDLDPGTYKVGEVLRDGWRQTCPGGGGFYSVAVDPNDIKTGCDFGNMQARPADLRGTTFQDVNGNGVRDAGETGLANFDVYLDSNDNGRWDTGEPQARTDAGGRYAFLNVPPGPYVVREIMQAGWKQTFPGRLGGRLFTCQYIEGASRTNIHEVDPADGTLLRTFSVPQGIPVMKGGDLAVGPVSLFFFNLVIDDTGFRSFLWELDPDSGGVIDLDEVVVGSDLLPYGVAYLNGKVYMSMQPYPFPDPPSTKLVRWNPQTDQIESIVTLDMAPGDDLAAMPHEGILLFPNGLNKIAKVDPTTGQVTAFIEHSVVPAAMVACLDGYIYRSKWNRPFTTYVIDPATGIIVRSFDMGQLPDLDGTGGDGLPAECYRVTITGGDIEGLDFGNVRVDTGRISGQLFDDRNENGLRDAGEPGLAGRRIFLDTNHSDTLDGGERHVLTDAQGTYAFEDLSAGRYVVAAAGACNWQQTSPDTMAAAFIEAPGPGDVLFDDHRGLLYLATSDGALQRYDLSTRAFLAPYAVGNDLNGMDITPDGAYLYVTEGNPGGSTGVLHKLDLSTGAVQNIPYPLGTYETGGWDVKIGAYGKALMTATYAGSAGNPIREVNLATDAITARTGVPGSTGDRIDDETRLFRSRNRGMFYAVGAYSSGYVFTYNAATDQFEQSFRRNEYLHNAPFAVGLDGSLLAYNNQHGSTWLYGAGFEPIMPFGGGDGGLVALDEARGRFWYEYEGAVLTRQIGSYEVLYRTGLGILSDYDPFVTGQAAIRGDGRFVAVTSRYLPVNRPAQEGVYLIEIRKSHDVAVTDGRTIDGVDFAGTRKASADLNHDRTVDSADFAMLADGWRTDEDCLDIAPAGGDARVDIRDLAAFASWWLAPTTAPFIPHEDFESGDLSKYPWRSRENPWTVTSRGPFEGRFCATSAEMPRYENSILEVTLNVKAGDISFVCKPGQYAGSFYFNIDGGTYLFLDEENADWGLYSIPVSEGEHTFTWHYRSRAYYAHAWLDAIRFPPLAE